MTFQRRGYPEPGVLADGQVIGLRGAGFESLISAIAGGADALDRVRRWVSSHPGAEQVDAAGLALAAPIPRPPKIICIGENYRDDAAEANATVPAAPAVFAKFPTAVVGPGHAIVLPGASREPDCGAELAVVIGKGGRHIRESRWREHVFGYTILNDVRARDFPMDDGQGAIGKTFDTFAPMGPAIVTADEIEDPHALDISMALGDDVMQHYNTRNLIFGVPRLIAYLSGVFTLEPGDVIATGTPSGAGFSREPPRYLMPGDECRIRIEGLGELVNPVVADGYFLEPPSMMPAAR